MTNATLELAPPVVDTMELYRWAVQDPEIHAVVLEVMYQRLRPGRQPLVLREDFAGTSAESVAWVAIKRNRRAIAVDLDGPTLEWARRRAARLLGPRAADVMFVKDDVHRVQPPSAPRADVLAVLNFSILYLHDPEALRAYLRAALRALAPEGVLVFNVFGGEGAVTVGSSRYAITPKPRLRAEEPIPAFEYAWEVRSFDAATRRIDARIHFEIPDASGERPGLRIRDAFTYDFRVWTPAELMSACREAGFGEVQVWRHTYDASRGADGVFLGPVDPAGLSREGAWTAYVVAAK